MVELDGDLARARREDLAGLLQELLRVPSVTGEKGAVGDVAGRHPRGDGALPRARRAAEHLREPSERRRYEAILVGSHTDTVDPGDPAAWRGIHSRATCSTDAAPV